MCPQHTYSLLEERFGEGRINLTDYGRIVASGFGRVPDDATLDMLKERYKVEFSFPRE